MPGVRFIPGVSFGCTGPGGAGTGTSAPIGDHSLLDRWYQCHTAGEEALAQLERTLLTSTPGASRGRLWSGTNVHRQCEGGGLAPLSTLTPSSHMHSDMTPHWPAPQEEVTAKGLHQRKLNRGMIPEQERLGTNRLCAFLQL